MSRDRVINAEDVIKALINNDSHWTDLLRKINFDERLKIVQDAVNMVLPTSLIALISHWIVTYLE